MDIKEEKEMHFGSDGERDLQNEMATCERAGKFYERQMHDHLTEKMKDLIETQEMMFLATSDSKGNCDCSPRFGHKGFVLIVDDKTLTYPEYRGNGVYASLGNILENPHVGMVFVDFLNSTVGLHVNGKAESFLAGQLPEKLINYFEQKPPVLDTPAERWVMITIDEAYIHCSKHVPLLEKKSKSISWGTDDPVAKSTDYFDE